MAEAVPDEETRKRARCATETAAGSAVLDSAKNNDLRQMVHLFNTLINARDENGWTACHFAAQHKNEGMLALLSSGTLLDLQDVVIEPTLPDEELPAVVVAGEDEDDQKTDEQKQEEGKQETPTETRTSEGPLAPPPTPASTTLEPHSPPLVMTASDMRPIPTPSLTATISSPVPSLHSERIEWKLELNAKTTHECDSIAAGSTPLHIAAATMNPTFMATLLSQGANAALLDSRGRSPLWLLVSNAIETETRSDAVTQCARLLLENGASPTEREVESGLTLLLMLSKLGHAPTLTCLLEVLAGVSSEEYVARTLQTGRADINCQCKLGFGPLHYASQLGDGESVLALLQYGAMPNARDKRMNTALHFAANSHVAVFLVSNGSRADLKNDQNVRADASTRGNDKAIKQAAEAYSQNSVVEAIGKGCPKPPGNRSSWVGDESSAACLACYGKFSMMVRRHHCRLCGMLVCFKCSNKNYKLGNDSLRTCDACFNILRKEMRVKKLEHTRLRAIQEEKQREVAEKKRSEDEKARKKKEAREAERRKREALEKAKENAAKKEREKELAAMRAKQEQEKRKSSPGKAGAGNKAGDVAAMAAQNKNLLIQRGEKLSEMEDKSAQLDDQAGDFMAMAKQLRKKNERSWF